MNSIKIHYYYESISLLTVAVSIFRIINSFHSLFKQTHNKQLQLTKRNVV